MGELWVTRESSESCLNVRLRSTNANMVLIIAKLLLFSRILETLMELWVTRESSESCLNVRLQSSNANMVPIIGTQSSLAKSFFLSLCVQSVDYEGIQSKSHKIWMSSG